MRLSGVIGVGTGQQHGMSQKSLESTEGTRDVAYCDLVS